MTNNTENSEWSRIVASSAIVVGGLSAFGFACSYAYEAAYCTVFGIPEDLIVIRPETVIASIFALVVFLAVLAMVFDLVVNLVRHIPRPWLLVVSRSGLLFGFGWFAVGYFLDMPNAFFLVLKGTAIWTIFDLGLPIFLHWEKKSFREKVQAQQELEADSFSVIFWVRRKAGPSALNLMMGMMLAILMATGLGHRQAAKKSEFLVSPDGSIVYLRTYGQNVLLGELTNGVLSHIRIVPVGRDILTFSLQAIGPLVVRSPGLPR